jgi:hypothetical protein
LTVLPPEGIDANSKRARQRRRKHMKKIIQTMVVIACLFLVNCTPKDTDVEPDLDRVHVEIIDVDLPNNDMSFTIRGGENEIVCTADLTPDRLDATYNSHIRWEIKDDPRVDGTSPTPDIINVRGHKVTIAIDIPKVSRGRGYQVLNYRIRAIFPLIDRSVYSQWRSIAQNEIDMLRQQYVDMRKNRIPVRGRFINVGATAHFDLREGFCRDGRHGYQMWSIMENLEDVRANLGHPMRINSGYRCPIHNTAVGGSVESQHMYGTAADVAVKDWDGNGSTDRDRDGIDDDWEQLRDAANAAGVSYIVPYHLSGRWLHMDWR